MRGRYDLYPKIQNRIRSPPDTKNKRDTHAPVCIGSADLLAEDIQRLLLYKEMIPRSVMVDYLKILLAFHLALYHLRLFKLLPRLVQRQGGDPICAKERCPMNPRSLSDPHGDCPHRIGLLPDVTGQLDSPMGTLAERSADTHLRRIPAFIKAYFTIRKLDECATSLVSLKKLPVKPGEAVPLTQLLHLLGPAYKADRERYFNHRLLSLLDELRDNDRLLPEDVQALVDLKLSDRDTYLEILVQQRGSFHRRYLTECLETMLLKNRPGAMISQRRTRGAPRRFILDSRLLEVLLQIAVLQPGGYRGYHTTELRIDELLTFLRERYGLYIDQLPPDDGFGAPSISDRQALRANRQAFVARLRQVGFYRDLSDAHITQTVSPRYTIPETMAGEETP